MASASARRAETPAPTDEGWVEALRSLRRGLEAGFARAGAPRTGEGSERRGSLRPARLIPVRSRLELRQVTQTFRLVDAAAIVVLALAFGHLAWPGGLLAARVGAVLPLLVGAGALMWGLRTLAVYAFAHRESLVRHLLRVSAAFSLSALAVEATILLLPGSRAGMAPAAIWFLAALAGLYVLHTIWWSTVSGWRRDGKLTPNIVIVGATEAARRLIETALRTREVAVLGMFDDRLGRAPRDIGGVPVLGDIDALISHRIMPYVDRVVIAVNPAAQARIRQLIDRLGVLPNEVSLVLDSGGEDGRQRALSRIADAQLAQVSGEPADIRRAGAKRIQDLVVASIALLLGWPLMLLVALAIKLDSPGPVFFRQRRHGFNNEEILVWKFRSMRQEAADFAAVQQVRAGDDRVTRIGRFIRKTSLDELPQLFNVLAGEMSLVGPRPHAVGMKTGQTESARLVAEYAHRHRMKPGMTGWAAINGSRGPVDTPELVRRRVALDIEYIERQSFWFDLYIMAMTIPCLLGDRDQVR
ncbi:MAG: exopolysaccharide biosynthesis polyprenyl glycosylphosphotransferase [Pseudomonadota bacterium]